MIDELVLEKTLDGMVQRFTNDQGVLYAEFRLALLLAREGV